MTLEIIQSQRAIQPELAASQRVQQRISLRYPRARTSSPSYKASLNHPMAFKPVLIKSTSAPRHQHATRGTRVHTHVRPCVRVYRPSCSSVNFLGPHGPFASFNEPRSISQARTDTRVRPIVVKRASGKTKSEARAVALSILCAFTLDESTLMRTSEGL